MKELNADELNLVKLASEYSDEDKARGLWERLRWPDGVPCCPHCQNKGAYALTPKEDSKSPVRKGVWKCKKCRKQFTARVGTILEDSHIPISTWLMAIFIICASKKGVSAKQLERMLDLTYKTAWFMAHRIRYAMSPELPLGKMLSGNVEIDEAYIGGKPRQGSGQINKRGRGTKKVPVVALVERGGEVRPKVVANVTHKNLRHFVNECVSKESTVHTDEYSVYPKLLKSHARHLTVEHSKHQYARKEADGTMVHCNTAESFFSLLKRGVIGAFHHVSKEHLQRYANEFGFRWNTRTMTDGERMVKAVKIAEGKRLTYKQPVWRSGKHKPILCKVIRTGRL